MRSETEADYQQRMLSVLLYIQAHLDEALDLKTLAAVAHFSPFHFHRIFRGMIGETVQAHVRRLRMERAAYRLKYSDQAVTRIAFEAGYETHEAFTRAFRTRFDESPSGFRSATRETVKIDAPSAVHYEPDRALDGFENQGLVDLPSVEVKDVAPIPVVFMRHQGPYDECGSTWQKVFGWVGSKGLFGPATAMIGVAYDDPDITPPDLVRYDACIRVEREVRGEGEVGFQYIGGGPYAATIHNGPYGKLSITYARLCGGWMAYSGREARTAPTLEFYRNSPQDTKPEDLVTEVYLPLEAQA